MVPGANLYWGIQVHFWGGSVTAVGRDYDYCDYYSDDYVGVVIWCFMLLSFVHAVAWYSDVEYPATDDDNGSDVGDSH